MTGMQSDVGPYSDVLDWGRWLRTALNNGSVTMFRKEVELITTCVLTDGLRGDPFYLSPQIASGVAEASRALPDVTLFPDAIPALSGFMRTEGLRIATLVPELGNDNPTEVGGLVWSVFACPCCTERGIGSCPSGDCGKHSLIVQTEKEMVRMGDGSVVHADQFVACSVDFALVLGHNAVGAGVGSIRFGERCGHEPSGMDNEIYPRVLRFFVTLLEFMQQRVVSVEHKAADRATRRRYERDESREAPEISIIALRRRAAVQGVSTATDHPIEWSCQWGVRPHPRQQWYPRLGVHRRRWIQGYIKGPPDKPLKHTERIFAVVR